MNLNKHTLVIVAGRSNPPYKIFHLSTFSSCTSFFTLNLIKSAIDGVPGELSNGGLIGFGKFDNASYNVWQLLVFAGRQ